MSRLLEGKNVATLRIYSRHHVLDRAVLARGIHALKYEQQSPAILGEEQFLHLADDGAVLFEQLSGVFLAFDAPRVGGVAILQPKLFALGDAVGFGEANGLFDEFGGFHDDRVVRRTVRTWARAPSRTPTSGRGHEAMNRPASATSDRAATRSPRSKHAMELRFRARSTALGCR